MHRRHFATCAILGLCLGSIPLSAQERRTSTAPAAATEVKPVTEESINSPPKREINFDRSEEPLNRRLGRPDPELLEFKWAAVFHFERTSPRAPPEPAPGSEIAASLMHWQIVLGGSYRSPYPNNDNEISLVESFRKAIDRIPEAEKPEPDVIEFFTSPDLSSKSLLSVSSVSPPRRGVIVTILAQTPELAEKRAAGYLKILDWGVLRPWAQEYWKQREQEIEAVKEAQMIVDAGNAQLAKFGDPKLLSGSSETLVPLRTQLVIERAGLAARIAAYDKLIANRELLPERRTRLEDEKLSAEVHLTDVETKIDLVGAILDQSFAQARVRRADIALRSTDAVIRALLPPPVVDGKILIQPLKWQIQ